MLTKQSARSGFWPPHKNPMPDQIAVPAPRPDRLGWLRGQCATSRPSPPSCSSVLFFCVASPFFATTGNMMNILTQVSVTGIIAVGLTFVILCAEIDLSVASIANATGIMVAFFTAQDLQREHRQPALAELSGNRDLPRRVRGAGAVNAFGLTVIGIPSFIMTLAMLQIAAAFARCCTRQIAYAVPKIVGTLAATRLDRFPHSVIVCAAASADRPLGPDLHPVRPLRDTSRELASSRVLRCERARRPSPRNDHLRPLFGLAACLRRIFRSAQQNEFDTYLLDSISAASAHQPVRTGASQHHHRSVRARVLNNASITSISTASSKSHPPDCRFVRYQALCATDARAAGSGG